MHELRRKQVNGFENSSPPFPAMSDDECAARLAEGYRQGFNESCLITWDEMEQRLDRLFERKRAQSV
jgi:hypothetical protein